jgi:ribosomal protein S8
MNLNLQKLLIQVKNGILKGKKKIVVTYSFKNISLLWQFKKEGFIRYFEVIEQSKKNKCLIVFLKYDETSCSAITELRIVSKVERRFFFRKTQMRLNNTGFNKYFFSNAQGIKSSSCGECSFILK